jgi:hypothetical protein
VSKFAVRLKKIRPKRIYKICIKSQKHARLRRLKNESLNAPHQLTGQHQQFFEGKPP